MSQSSAAPLRARLPRLPRIAEDAVARARLTVVPRKRQKAAKVPFVALVTLVLLGGVVGLLLFNTSMQQASFAATALQDQADTLAAREQTLRMELDVLRDPQRIAQQAQAMGMVPATNTAFIDLKEHGKVLGVATPAQRVPFRIRPKVPAPPAGATIVKHVPAPGAATHGSGASTGHHGSQQHQQSHGSTARPTR